MDLLHRVIDLACQIQQIPAPTFQEGERAAFLQQRFMEEGLADVGQDDVGNVYARLSGAGEALPLVVSAHLDTVFPLETDLTLTRQDDYLQGPGIGDNSLGLAALFGLLWHLRAEGVSLPGDLWLVANVGEEGLGNLRGMHAVVDRFGRAPLAYIVLEGMGLGQVYHRGLGVRRYRITLHTEGGHSWVHHGRPSAVHELARLVTHLTRIPLPASPRTTLNVGVIQGGTTVNTIASTAWLELDLRSESPDALASLSRTAETLAQQTARRGVRVDVEVIGNRPAGELPARHSLVQSALAALREQGVKPQLNIGSTDANAPLSRGLPAICLGLTEGGGAHSSQEYIRVEPLARGLTALTSLVRRVWRHPPTAVVS